MDNDVQNMMDIMFFPLHFLQTFWIEKNACPASIVRDYEKEKSHC